MKERPIMFSAPMVLALLADTKTQTRRVVKIRGLDFGGGGPKDGPDWNDPSCWGFEDINTGQQWALAKGECVDQVFACPYGATGDRLWVRETWAAYDQQAINEREREGIFYRADNPKEYDSDGPWKSSLFMPRWASRITLEVTAVRVERLQDISEADAIAEGQPADSANRPRVWYMTLWDSINGKRAPWASNPWVWVIEFRRIAPATA